MARQSSYLAVYGNTGIKKAWRKECKAFGFIVNDERGCCGAPFTYNPKRWKRESLPCGFREKPGNALGRQILESQQHKCLYCDKQFGSLVWVKNVRKRLRHVWDHRIPFAFLRGNPKSNWVASCQVCNGWKSDLLFNNLEEIRVYVAVKWEKSVSQETVSELPQ